MTRSIGGAKQWTMCTSWISVNLLCAQILKHHSAMESVTFLRISGLVTDTKSKYPRETVVWHRGESGRTIVAKWHIKDKTGYQAWIMTVKQSCKNMKNLEYYSHLLIPPTPPLLTLVQRCSFCKRCSFDTEHFIQWTLKNSTSTQHKSIKHYKLY